MGFIGLVKPVDKNPGEDRHPHQAAEFLVQGAVSELPGFLCLPNTNSGSFGMENPKCF